MSVSVLERLGARLAARPQGGAGRVKGIYHNWKEGASHIRLAGDFTEVRTHFISPSTSGKRKDRGLCIPAAFEGDDKIPKVINCLNWDIALERPRKEKTCPICKLNAIARAVLTENPGPDEKAFFEALRASTRATSVLKWNILDRDEPFVIVTDNGKEEKVLGFKIASIGAEASNDILGIFKQVGYDIQDPDRGIDIEVIKDSKGVRTTYSARAMIEGTSLKVTPFTAAERALELHDLKVRCGKVIEADKIVDALHEDLREVLSVNVADGVTEEAVVDAAVEEAVAEVSEPEVAAPAAAPAVTQKVVAKAAAPAAAPVQKAAPAAAAPRTAAPQTRPTQAAAAAPTGKVPASVLDRLHKKAVAAPAVEPTAEAGALEEALAEGDGDGILDGTDAKKK